MTLSNRMKAAIAKAFKQDLIDDALEHNHELTEEEWGAYLNIVEEASEEEDTVILLREDFEELVKDRDRLRDLEAAGVDNWEGYEYAIGNKQ